MLRESTRALTFTFPNSVSVALGISSVSSRNRAAVGFHSTREPFTWYATVFPPPGHTPVTPARARWPARGTRASKADTISWSLPGIGKIIALGFPAAIYASVIWYRPMAWTNSLVLSRAARALVPHFLDVAQGVAQPG